MYTARDLTRIFHEVNDAFDKQNKKIRKLEDRLEALEKKKSTPRRQKTLDKP